MAFYYCNEDDRILNTDDIRQNYQQFGDEYDSFNDYLTACMYWNNGALIPLADHVNAIRRRLSNVLSFIRNEAEREYYADEIETLTAEIARCEII